MIHLHYALAALALTSAPTGAWAEAREPAPIFGVVGETDGSLDAVRGMAPPFASLTRGQLTVAASTQSRDDFRFVGSVLRTGMDNWWGTTGAEMIAEAVRAGP